MRDTEEYGGKYIPIVLSQSLYLDGSSGHHRWRGNNTFSPFPVFRCPKNLQTPHHRWRGNNTFSPFPVFRCPQKISKPRTTDGVATIHFHLSLSSDAVKKISKPHSCPFFDVVFPSLLLSSSPSCSFHCLLQNWRILRFGHITSLIFCFFTIV